MSVSYTASPVVKENFLWCYIYKTIVSARKGLEFVKWGWHNWHDDSRQIFKHDMLYPYAGCPSISYSGRKCAILDGFFFATFSRYYDITSSDFQEENDSQLNESPDKLMSSNKTENLEECYNFMFKTC